MKPGWLYRTVDAAMDMLLVVAFVLAVLFALAHIYDLIQN